MEDGIPRQLQHCHKTCCKKGGCCGRWACIILEMISLWECNFQTDGLAYNIEYYCNHSTPLQKMVSISEISTDVHGYLISYMQPSPFEHGVVNLVSTSSCV